MGAYVVIGAAALFFSALTLFTGFGLGTLLLPVFAVFFAVEAAVAVTAVVHLANNLFKLALFAGQANWRVVARFGLPAVAASFGGAYVLQLLAQQTPLATYAWPGGTAIITPLKLVMAVLIAFFAYLELSPRFRRWQIDRRYMPLGGLLSGFFGGLSGHQGAFRGAVLAKAGLAPEAFIGTNAVIASLVDVARLSVYGAGFVAGHFAAAGQNNGWGLALMAILAAFAGALIGRRLARKVAGRTIQWLVGSLLLVIAIGLAAGIV
jgi:uncharacterized membrane protein YfcA